MVIEKLHGVSGGSWSAIGYNRVSYNCICKHSLYYATIALAGL